MSNLKLIKEVTVTSGQATVSVTDVFSSDYDIYQVSLTGFYAAGIDYFYLRLINSSDAVVSDANYDLASLEMKSNTSFNERRSTNYTNMFPSTNFLGNSEAESYNEILYFFNPVSASSYTFMVGESSQFEYGHSYNNKKIGVLKQAVSMTGFQLLVGSLGHTLSGGKVRVYGLKVD